MRRYLCTSCDHEFEHDEAEPRCPKCLRKNGVEELVDERDRRRKAAARKPRRAMAAGLGVAVVALIISAILLHRTAEQVPKKGELGPLDTAALTRTLRARGLADADIVDPFSAGQSVRALVGTPPSGDDKARALALAAKVGAKLAPLEGNYHGQGFDGVRTAEELASDLANKAIHVKSVTSYEAATLLLAVLRQAGLNALLCEIFELDAATRAADIVGSLGRYAVAVYAKGKLGRDPLVAFDPLRATKLPRFFGGGDPGMVSKAKALVPLDDGSAAAHLLSLRALSSIQRDPTSPSRAYELSQLALGAASPSPTLHVARAQVLALAGGSAGIDDAIDELRKAAALRSDGPRRVALAQLLMVKGETKRAEQEISSALKDDPTFWPAHQTLATLRLLTGDREGSRKHLDLAVKAAADEPSVMALKASALLADGDDEQAVALLQRSAKIRPTEQTLLQLYVALLKRGEYKRAKVTKKELLELARDAKRVQATLKQIDDAAGISADDDTPASAPASQPGPAPVPGGFKLPDVKLAPPKGPEGQRLGPGGLTPPSGEPKPFKLPDVKLTP